MRSNSSHSRLLCCFLLLVLCAGCASKGAPETAQPKSNPMGLSGKLNPEAETAFSQARVLWRSSQALQTRTSEVCSNPEEAITLLDKAISLEPGFAAAYVRRGLAKSDLGQHEAAFDDATAGIRLDPTPENYAYRGLISTKAKDYTAARKDLDYSLERNPSQHLAWTLRGVLSLLEGNDKAACDDFKNACSRGDCSRLDVAQQEGLCR